MERLADPFTLNSLLAVALSGIMTAALTEAAVRANAASGRIVLMDWFSFIFAGLFMFFFVGGYHEVKPV